MDDPALAGIDLDDLDPTPDVHALFAYYNALYFDNQLGACSVEWSSKRMTLCAGVCHFQSGGGCRIKLSEPLLKFRPVRDLKDTLLHEMIHAALFLRNVRDDGDHGPQFRALMHRINAATCPDAQRPAGGYNITVFHTMHDEVNTYRTHVWRCMSCGNMVRRAMNRPPQEADCRAYSKAAAAAAPGAYCHDPRCMYHGHVRTCGGVYEKIAEPEKPQAAGKQATGSGGNSGNKQAKTANKRRPTTAAGAPAITSFFPRHEAADGQQQQAGSRKPTDPRAAAAAAALARAAAAAGGAAAASMSSAAAAAAAGASGGDGLRQPVQLPRQQQQGQQNVEPQEQHHSKQQQEQAQRRSSGRMQGVVPTEVVELLSDSSDEGEPAGPVTSTGAARAAGGAAAAAAGGAGAGPSRKGQQGGGRGVLLCPVCCLEFAQLADLNRHLDTVCLL